MTTCSTSASPAIGRTGTKDLRQSPPGTVAALPDLSGLVGRTLHHVWLVRDLGSDEWFIDCPVVLGFGDERVEINHQKTDDLSITFNSIDPRQPLTWPTSDDFQLAWLPEPIEQLDELRGQELRHARLLEWVGNTMANGSIALGFAFPRDT